MATVLAIAELRDGEVRDESFELIAAARLLADARGDEVVTLLPGHDIARQADELARYGRVLYADDPALADYSLDAYRAALQAAVAFCDADRVLFSATPIGWDLAPRLAAALDAGYVGSVTGIESAQGHVLLTRRVFGGKLETRVAATAGRIVMTVEAGACDAAQPVAGATVERLSFAPPASARTRFVERRSADALGVDLTKADVIVAGGRGVGDAEKFAAVIEPLARALGAAVGASRPVVDAGWLPRAHQVGSSGQVVKPKVYIACGISGAVQHLAGMKNAGYIVAINRDARAPIFAVADLGVAADLHDIVPALTAALEDRSD